ncbi:MAG: hypothetical protein OXG36_18590 [Caldilineaceae bacterium]|nr:hypothetical protein [Caldilineaceae bacterium]
MVASLEPPHMILVALAAGGAEATLDPVQVQHLLFLIDATIPEAVDGPHFKFASSAAGPVDASIKFVLLQMCREGSLSTRAEPQGTVIFLTAQGLATGEAVLTRCGEDVRSYLSELYAWVGAHDFRRRLSGIRARFPDMFFGYAPTPAAQVQGDDPRRSLIREYTQTSRWDNFVVGLGRAFDMYGTLIDHDRWHSALQAVRAVPTPAPDPWVEVGDCLREAMAQLATELPSSIEGEDSHVTRPGIVRGTDRP